MKKIILSFVSVIIVFIMIVGCAPRTKESYIERCDKYYDNVSKSYKTYTAEDWEKFDRDMALYYEEYYANFEDELSTKEKIKIASQMTKLLYFREMYNIKNAYDSLKQDLNINYTQEDFEEDVNSVIEYFENDFVDDMKEIGIETEEFLNDVWSDFEDCMNSENEK